jgi:hypothetical protein
VNQLFHDLDASTISLSKTNNMPDSKMTTRNSQVKRGAKPTPRHVLAAAMPHVALPGMPPNSIIVPKKLSMWNNDITGDCVTAEEAFAKACHSPEIFITDDEVKKWATAHGVWDGAYLTDVLNAMQTDGFTQDGNTYDDGRYFSVNWTDAPTLQSAISQGPVKIGVAGDPLEPVCQAQGYGKSGWFATALTGDPSNPQLEDHCVSLCGYGTISWLAQQLNVGVPKGVDGTKPGYALFTWDSIGIIDIPSLLAITYEAWLRTPTTIVR